MKPLSSLLAFALLSARGVAAQTDIIEADVAIYGGTSGGVVAAVQAARLGKSAVIIEPGRHLGGMTSGGLSWTDVGASDRIGAVGGIAREVYERIGAHYGQKPGTVFDAPKAAAGGNDFEKPPSLAFEPKVAEQVFNEMVDQAKVGIHLEARVTSVRREGRKIRELVLTTGAVVRAKMFIDATYEGDLLPLAKISYTLGREANSQYGETNNGIQGAPRGARGGLFDRPLNPFVNPGDPTSGLLPYLLRDEGQGQVGTADQRIQSYNFRLCLTDNPANRIPLAPPADYHAANFELLARWIDVQIDAGVNLTLRSFVKYDPLQNGKFDFNNRWPISTDFIGGADEYPEANPARRAEIAKAHEDYLRGFFHFLRTDPRVPAAVREETSRFGLPRDEFTDNGGWPHQIYVREARRMVSDFVMTEYHVTNLTTAPHSVGLGAYGVDIHAVRRIAIGGQPTNEGGRSLAVPRPYPIAHDAIVPKAAECENLLVPFALSASHVAFGSIRMEPVFMTLAQSAATAATLAIADGVSVQRVDYNKLRAQLAAGRVVLDWHEPIKPATATQEN